MKDLFKDILEIDDVQGALFVSLDGKIVFKNFLSHLPEGLEKLDWPAFIQSLDKIQETELIFEHVRFYVRRTGSGFIFVLMGTLALIEMVRLNCNILIPSIEQKKIKPKGLGSFFKLK